MEENNNLKQYHFDPLKYYISFAFFSFSNGLFSIFINVLFFASSNISEVIYFQISLQISQTVFFLLGTYLIAYVSARFLYSLGAFLKAIVIASLFISPFFSGNAIYFGLLYGVSSGIFWTGNATFTLAISRSIKRFNFLSINSALSCGIYCICIHLSPCRYLFHRQINPYNIPNIIPGIGISHNLFYPAIHTWIRFFFAILYR